MRQGKDCEEAYRLAIPKIDEGDCAAGHFETDQGIELLVDVGIGIAKPCAAYDKND